MLQLARCETDLPTTAKVAEAVDEPMRVFEGPSRGVVCCPCGTVIDIGPKGHWPALAKCDKCQSTQN